jgi:IS5 family transposase
MISPGRVREPTHSDGTSRLTLCPPNGVKPTITRRTGHPPRVVTADRGYGQASVERDLHGLGVRSVAIPRISKPSAARREFEHRRAFRDKVKWRTGSEGRINHIKRSYG